MKKLAAILLFATIIANFTFAQSSSSSQKDGEDLDLKAVLGKLEEVSSFEELEKALNDSSQTLNNLDLNKDGKVDYITVIENKEKNVHIATLRVLLSEKEQQDVANIVIEKTSDTKISLQIIGDEDLYGKDYIVQPDDGYVSLTPTTGKQNTGGHGPSAEPWQIEYSPTAVYFVIVPKVYAPTYVVYVSPVRYAIYPRWYRPYHPMARSSYVSKSARYHRHYAKKTHVRRCHTANNMIKHNRKKTAYKTKYHHNNKSHYNKSKNYNNKNNYNKNQTNNKNKNYNTNTNRNQPNTKANNKKTTPNTNKKMR